MRPFTTTVTALCTLLMLGACDNVKKGPEWVEEVDGNQLTIYTLARQEEDGSMFRTVHIENTKRTWAGKLKGDKEMVEARKKMLLERAEKEAKRTCGNKTAVATEEASYAMVDRNTEVYNGGALGVLIGAAMDSAMSDYKNLPTSMGYRFVCKDANGVAEKLALPAAETSVQNPAEKR